MSADGGAGVSGTCARPVAPGTRGCYAFSLSLPPASSPVCRFPCPLHTRVLSFLPPRIHLPSFRLACAAEPPATMVDVCETRLELHLEGRDLRDMDLLSKSDPFAVVYLDATGPSGGGGPGASAESSGPLGSGGVGSSGGIFGAPARASTTSGGLGRRPSTGLGRLRRGSSAPADPAGGAPSAGGPPGPLHAAPAAEAARWVRLGATETIQDNLHPKWVTSLELRYYFERTQRLRVDVYDRDGPAADLSRHDFIGWASITVPELVRSSGQRVELPLRNERRGGANGGVGVVPATSGANGGGGGANATAPKVTSKNGFITIRAEEVSALKQTVTLDFGVTRLRRGMLASLSKSRPHLVLSRALEDGAWLRVHRSAGGTPTATRGEYRFPRHVMSFEKLCRCDEGVPLRVDVLYERSGKETVVASTVLSLRRLIGAKSVALAAAGKPAGELIVHGVSVTAEHSFLDYIIGGCEVSLIVAIDFTASNGDPVRPGTLHYRDPARPNEYEAATRAVGDILANYDSDQRFPAFGFGAKLPPDYRAAQHCFSLTGDVNPVCEGVDGILDCYRETLFNVRLSGPTVFAEIVRTAALYASTNVSQAEQKYTILLIITDGVVNDMAATKEAIIHASALPLSIVIVGVGDADFSDMNLLDGDDRPLGPGMSRDIVQFVPYRQFRDFPEILASRVLEEVPTQLLDYMKSQRLVPNPPVPFDPAAVASPAALRAAAGATQSPLPPSPVTVPPSVPPQYRYGPAGLMMAAGGAPVGGGGDPYGGLLGSQGAQLFGGPAAAGGGVAAGGPPQPPVPPGHPYGGGETAHGREWGAG